jgi:hypothetical protein
MIQAINVEEVFVTSLEKFISKADKFIKTYYSGVSEENHICEIIQELKILISDADVQELESNYQHYCELKDLMADYDDSAWF